MYYKTALEKMYTQMLLQVWRKYNNNMNDEKKCKMHMIMKTDLTS